MAFGRWPLSGFKAATQWGVAAAAVALLIVGCGGGGGGDNGNPGGGGNGGGSKATLTGQAVDSQTASPIAGVTVTFGGASVLTDALGKFSIQANAPTTAQPALFSKAGYQQRGQYQSSIVNLATNGVVVTPIAAGATVDVGIVRMYSLDTPPPPPTFP